MSDKFVTYEWHQKEILKIKGIVDEQMGEMKDRIKVLEIFKEAQGITTATMSNDIKYIKKKQDKFGKTQEKQQWLLAIGIGILATLQFLAPWILDQIGK